MAEPTISLTVADAVALVTLCRPQARNALSVAMCEELIAALAQVDRLAAAGNVRVATLQAQPPVFCAGADLKERKDMPPAQMSAHSKLIARCADALEQLSCPTIAWVQGAALGGGCELALACDLRVASTAATFGFPEVGYGFFPGAGGPVRLTRLVGFANANYLLLTGDRIDAAGAQQMGVVHFAQGNEEADATRRRLERQLAAYPPNGIRALRRLLASLQKEQDDAGMALARRLRDELDHDAHVRAGLAAFG